MAQKIIGSLLYSFISLNTTMHLKITNIRPILVHFSIFAKAFDTVNHFILLHNNNSHPHNQKLAPNLIDLKTNLAIVFNAYTLYFAMSTYLT